MHFVPTPLSFCPKTIFAAKSETSFVTATVSRLYAEGYLIT